MIDLIIILAYLIIGLSVLGVLTICDSDWKRRVSPDGSDDFLQPLIVILWPFWLALLAMFALFWLVAYPFKGSKK